MKKRSKDKEEEIGHLCTRTSYERKENLTAE